MIFDHCFEGLDFSPTCCSHKTKNLLQYQTITENLARAYSRCQLQSYCGKAERYYKPWTFEYSFV